MRKLFLLLFIVAFSATAYAQAESKGADGIPWGTKMESLKGKYDWRCKVDKDDASVTYCELDRVQTQYGRGSKVFTFFDGKFASLDVTVRGGLDDWNKIKGELSKTYGKQKESAGDDEYMQKKGKTAVIGKYREDYEIINLYYMDLDQVDPEF